MLMSCEHEGHIGICSEEHAVVLRMPAPGFVHVDEVALLHPKSPTLSSPKPFTLNQKPLPLTAGPEKPLHDPKLSCFNPTNRS